MACNETVLAIMSRVNPDTLVDSTTSLLLVRAQLWHYALEKVTLSTLYIYTALNTAGVCENALLLVDLLQWCRGNYLTSMVV